MSRINCREDRVEMFRIVLDNKGSTNETDVHHRNNAPYAYCVVTRTRSSTKNLSKRSLTISQGSSRDKVSESMDSTHRPDHVERHVSSFFFQPRCMYTIYNLHRKVAMLYV